MDDDMFQIGDLVEHPTRDEWGPGKIVRVGRDRVWVVWRDLAGREAKVMVTTAVPLRRAALQNDPVLENLPEPTDVGGKLLLPSARITLKEAKEAFLAKFPLGFEDPKYFGDRKSGERYYKLNAHEYASQHLNPSAIRACMTDNHQDIVGKLEKCASMVNLLHMTEFAAFRDGLRDAKYAGAFLDQLAALLSDDVPNKDSFEAYVRSLQNLPASGHRVDTWPVATLIPYLFNPSQHMLLKPDVTKRAAEALSFNLNYDSQPNWLTYSRLLAMTRIYLDLLKELKPKDHIDVQSFFWVAAQSARG